MIDYPRTFTTVMPGLMVLLLPFLLFLPSAAGAQPQGTMTREVEVGALFTSGNTDEETLNFAGAINIDRDQWDYAFTMDGLFASSDNRVKGQRIGLTARANYQITDYNFFQTRASHEDDRFSGFDSQSDMTLSYGHELLRNRGDMRLTTNAGVGSRYSRRDGGTNTTEPILRLASEYRWTLSESAEFYQDVSAEAGSDSNIYRSRTTIETDIMDNLSLRFSIKIKHQTDVPAGKANTDTETAVTFVMNF